MSPQWEKELALYEATGSSVATGGLSCRMPKEGLICHQITGNNVIRDWFSLS